jgi:hypothetical protein
MKRMIRYYQWWKETNRYRIDIIVYYKSWEIQRVTICIAIIIIIIIVIIASLKTTATAPNYYIDDILLWFYHIPQFVSRISHFILSIIVPINFTKPSSFYRFISLYLFILLLILIVTFFINLIISSSSIYLSFISCLIWSFISLICLSNCSNIFYYIYYLITFCCFIYFTKPAHSTSTNLL